MPNITNFTPAWLAAPHPAHQIFTPSSKDALSSNSNGKRNTKPGPLRTIARRGTEVFVAVGKEIRWADLVYLKEAYEDGEERSRESRRRGKETSQYEEDHAQGYRTIKTPVADDIRQLIISPNSNFLAILTTHTVHIAVLPEPSHLTASDTGPLRLKIFMLGPVTHVTTQSSVSSAIWHPLGVNGTCLVTVTEDAVVRVWELSVSDRQSFDHATLAIDLKKLADGTSVDQDFGASVSQTNKGFSPDSFEMEVASACFAGRGSGGWSPMTLWVAMREGDVYALCPLLPKKWSPPATLIPSLSVSIVAKNAALEDDPDVSQKAKLLARQQQDWMSDLDNQEPTHAENDTTSEFQVEVFSRPSKPGRVPKLQGPCEFDLAPPESEEELDTLLTDIYVVGAKMDGDELMLGEEDDLELDEIDEEGLSIDVVCLLASSGRLSVYLNTEGVEAQWLPKTKSRFSRFVEDADPPSLLTFELLDTSKAGELVEESWPVFSPDVSSPYSFYITSPSSITFISLAWISRLETELAGSAPGTEFRIDLLVKGQRSIRQRIYPQRSGDRPGPFAASSLVLDPDLGYFLLTVSPNGPVGISFEAPEASLDVIKRSRSPSYDSEIDYKPAIFYEPREVYQPASTFKNDSNLPKLLQDLRKGKYKHTLKSEVRLSPATLSIMTGTHKILSEETHRLGMAAAELFRRCELLQIELRDQIKKASDVAKRVAAITGDDCDEGPVETREAEISRRIKEASERQIEITERIERVRKRVSKNTSRELSEKEKAWIEELRVLEAKILPQNDTADSDSSLQPWQRLQEVAELKDELLEQIKEVSVEEGAMVSRDVRVPVAVRKGREAEAFKMLNRTTALVEAAKTRLERLSVSE